jgi:3-phenylpropionate/cinnamic acid dioxygenase small subunit
MIPASQQMSDLSDIGYIINVVAAALDDGQYEPWLGCFLPDALYCGITSDSLKTSGPNLFTDFGVDGRKERVAFWLGMWQVGRSRIRHIVGRTLLVEVSGDTVKVKTPFLVTRTADDGETKLHVSAVYHDDWVKSDNGWKLAWRRVVIDCEVLPSNFTDPL